MNNENTVCALCGSQHFKKQFTAGDFDSGDLQFSIIECAECGFAYIDPQPSAEQLGRFYTSVYYGSNQRKFGYPIEKLTQLGNYLRAREIKTLLRRSPARILDIGCGRANLLQAFQAQGDDCYGVEHPQFQPPEVSGIHFFTAKDLAELHFEENFFDAVVIWHVLEHLPQPFAVLDEIQRILKPGGVLAVAVPNFGSLQSRFFGAYWFHLDLPRHLFHFSAANLQQALEQRHFKPVKITTHSLEQNIFGFMQSALNMMPFFSKPNALYSVLKKGQSSKKVGIAEALLAIILGGLIFPVAIAEYLVSGWRGAGATAIVFAVKNTAQTSP